MATIYLLTEGSLANLEKDIDAFNDLSDNFVHGQFLITVSW